MVHPRSADRSRKQVRGTIFGPGSSTNPQREINPRRPQDFSTGTRYLLYDGLGKMWCDTPLRGRKLLHGTSSIPKLEHAVRNTSRKHTPVTQIKCVREEEPQSGVQWSGLLLSRLMNRLGHIITIKVCIEVGGYHAESMRH